MKPTILIVIAFFTVFLCGCVGYVEHRNGYRVVHSIGIGAYYDPVPTVYVGRMSRYYSAPACRPVYYRRHWWWR